MGLSFAGDLMSRRMDPCRALGPRVHAWCASLETASDYNTVFELFWPLSCLAGSR